jgi:hypothetical protein
MESGAQTFLKTGLSQAKCAPDSLENWPLQIYISKKKLIDAALCAQCQD